MLNAIFGQVYSFCELSATSFYKQKVQKFMLAATFKGIFGEIKSKLVFCQMQVDLDISYLTCLFYGKMFPIENKLLQQLWSMLISQVHIHSRSVMI